MVKMLWQFDMSKEKIFETVSQIKIHYRNSELSEGKAGEIHGGDRLPYVKVDDTDNFANFDGVAWQVQVYGEATPELKAWCDKQQVKPIQFDW